MKPQKTFDCVEMKWDIQQRLLQEEAELGRDKAKKRRLQRILADPVFGPVSPASRIMNGMADTREAPCIAVIGPANSGKTTLLHLLDDALRQQPAEPLFYIVKGSPDGSGRYLLHSRNLRNEHKGKWMESTLPIHILPWIGNARRQLEIVLVDVGGSRDEKARPGNEELLKRCSHYLVVARRFPDPAEEAVKGMDAWIRDAESAGLKEFARLESVTLLGDPLFDRESRHGLFRGDVLGSQDRLNDPVVEQLAGELAAMRLERGPGDYLNLRRRPMWRDRDLPTLDGRLPALQRAVLDDGEVILGGKASIFAYAAAFHHALNANPRASVHVFDPKVVGGEVRVPLPSSGPGFPAELLHLSWIETPGQPLRLHLAAATDDKFLGPDVLQALPFLPVPDHPSLPGATVEIYGAGPIWLHLALSHWVRSKGAARIGHWDASFQRTVWVWPSLPTDH